MNKHFRLRCFIFLLSFQVSSWCDNRFTDLAESILYVHYLSCRDMGTKPIKSLPDFKRYNWYSYATSKLSFSGFFNNFFAWDHLDEFICLLIPSSVKHYLNVDLLKTDTQIPGNMPFTWICGFTLVLVSLYLIVVDVKIWPLEVLRKILWFSTDFILLWQALVSAYSKNDKYRVSGTAGLKIKC